jgi:Na+/H+-translocating membrane pyrophosphatase
MIGVRIALGAAPIVMVLLFYLLISSTPSNLIAFTALVISLVFIAISLWMLCWILDKDQGSRAMQDISDPIKEGSEGFFITQYGTIFKLALVCALLLFLVYLQRAPAGGESKLHLYLGTTSMALITSISFLLGANCSALSGYAGIWVSVRANVRVAAAARKCYNEALQICFRGGAFSAIINVALAIFGISFMYLFMSLIFYINSPDPSLNPPIEEIPVVLVGFGFGASFVAMFA